MARAMLVIMLSMFPFAVAVRTVGTKTTHFNAMPRHMYRSDCFQSRPVGSSHRQSLLRGSVNISQGKNPGAGVGKIEPFVTVLKDGFYLVACVKDYMFEYGDKYGDNKFSYAVGESAGVSIVHYSMHVAKEDQEPMSHSACFAFCRTVPNMNFFGMTNGRECYCSSYYQMEAGDSSQCDAVCEGDTSTMCGGKSKSSIFSMHNCDDTASDIADGQTKMDAVQQELTEISTAVGDAADKMQSLAADFQASFGKAGDGAASDSMQSAKVFAGEATHAAADGRKLITKMEGFATQAGGMGNDFSNPEMAKDAEALVSNMGSATMEGKDELEILAELKEQILPDADDDTAAAAEQEYYSMMYFVDKEFVNQSSTCTGTSAGKPLVSTYGHCAAACDAAVHDCVGFSFYAKPSEDTGVCFLFSGFKSATYYTGCPDKVGTVKCAAKLSSFVGTTLKPDGSGECKQCLKELTKADRCFQ